MAKRHDFVFRTATVVYIKHFEIFTLRLIARCESCIRLIGDKHETCRLDYNKNFEHNWARPSLV